MFTGGRYCIRMESAIILIVPSLSQVTAVFYGVEARDFFS